MQTSEITENTTIDQDDFNRLLAKVYGWTFLGLMLTAVSAYSTHRFFNGVLNSLNINPETLFGIVFFEFALVWGIKAFVNRFPIAVSYFAFIIYAILNGFIIMAVFNFFKIGHIPKIFGVIALMFAVPAVLGMVLKVNLGDLGGFLLLFLFGAAAVITFNIIQNAVTSDWIISSSAFFIFLVLALLHRQKIRMWCAGSWSYTRDGSKPSILGALMLYLDFIVLFIIIERFIKDGD